MPMYVYYQGVGSVSFSENFANVLNEGSPNKLSNKRNWVIGCSTFVRIFCVSAFINLKFMKSFDVKSKALLKKYLLIIKSTHVK